MNAPSLLAAAPACCEDELWERLPDWPHHEASTCGRGRVVDWVDERGLLHLGRILPQHADKRRGKGYMYFILRDGKRQRKVGVAVAVLEAHRGLRPFPDWEACHNGGVRTNNHLAKLRWDTREANLAEMWASRRLTADTGQASETPEACPGAGFPGDLRSGDPCRTRVQGNGSIGTGSFRPLPISPPSSTSLNPSNLSLRTLLRSVRDRLAA